MLFANMLFAVLAKLSEFEKGEVFICFFYLEH